MLWLVYICYNVPYWKTKDRKTEGEREREETENKEFPNNVLFWKRWWQIERTKRSFFKVNLINRTQNNNIYCNIYISVYHRISRLFKVSSDLIEIPFLFLFVSCTGSLFCPQNLPNKFWYQRIFSNILYIYWSYIYNIYILILLFIIFLCNNNVNNFFPFRKLTKQLSVSFIDEKKNYIIHVSYTHIILICLDNGYDWHPFFGQYIIFL